MMKKSKYCVMINGHLVVSDLSAKTSKVVYRAISNLFELMKSNDAVNSNSVIVIGEYFDLDPLF